MRKDKQEKIHKVKCKVCHEKWIPRTAAPKKCPACQSREWDGKEVYRRTAGAARNAKRKR